MQVETMRSIEDVAKELAAAHRAADPKTTLVKLFSSLQDNDIRLLEVSSAVPAIREAMPFPICPRPGEPDRARVNRYPSQSRRLARGSKWPASLARRMGHRFREGYLMPVSIRDWSDPFLEQAREDLRAAWAVSAAGGSPSTLCMLIQMVFEKLAKAAYARSGQGVLKTHKAASHLFAMLLRHPTGKNLLTERPNVQQFIIDLENAHPASVNAERKIWGSGSVELRVK